jgi:hypothetical protein
MPSLKTSVLYIALLAFIINTLRVSTILFSVPPNMAAVDANPPHDNHPAAPVDVVAADAKGLPASAIVIGATGETGRFVVKRVSRINRLSFVSLSYTFKLAYLLCLSVVSPSSLSLIPLPHPSPSSLSSSLSLSVRF